MSHRERIAEIQATKQEMEPQERRIAEEELNRILAVMAITPYEQQE